VRRFSVQGVAGFKELPELFLRIVHLKQWARGIVPQTPKEFFRLGAQIHYPASLVQMLSISGSQHHPAASGEYLRGRVQRQFIDDFLLQISKSIFTFASEEVPD
jgi:hypothetical protein